MTGPPERAGNTKASTCKNIDEPSKAVKAAGDFALPTGAASVMCGYAKGSPMNAVETTALGIVQGLTEFLPVSSSGHLVLLQNLLGVAKPQLMLDCTLHLGTLLAVCLYFRSDLSRMAQRLWRRDFQDPHASLALWVIVGTIPTGLIGILFKDFLERLFGSAALVGWTLLVTGLIVGSTRLISEGHGSRKRVGLWAALAVGLVQGLAITPGISRSGITIVCGLLLGLDRDLAGRFSFLLSIPAIVGAVVLQIHAGALQGTALLPLACGFVSSTIVGILALRVLMGMVRKGHLYYFAPYCWLLGIVVVLAT